MPKTTPPPDFKIHVDSSCLTDSTDLNMSPERVSSNQTIIHHDDWLEGNPAEEGHEGVEKEAEEHRNPVEHEDDAESEAYPDPTKSELARERQIDRIEAQIQAAARAVVASIEEDNYHGEDSILSTRTDESYYENSQLTCGDGTELTYHMTDATYETEDEHHERDGEGDSSSHHDGDIDDDVFSHSDRSGRSSLNSCHDLHSSDEIQGKELTSPVVGEEAAEPVSRIPSAASFTPKDSTQATPSRVLSRPPFRTPSSVRAMQMSSPTPSIFSSPRSTKRHLPTVSRIGTPNSHYSSPSKKTPTRFKVKKEYPLVLLHVTVLPLSWNHSHLMFSPDLPPTLHSVKDNWRLLQEKLGDTVLERGILLPHPQDSYEVLEERLLEALELPVRPRARILKCGHYMGPETPISLEEDAGDQHFQGEERKWCDICGRDVRIEGNRDGTGEQRFRIKIYASNGLMRAGAWAAAWREMERVDVEIEPFVEGGLAVELEHMSASATHVPQIDHDDGFEDEEEHSIEHTEERSPEQLQEIITLDEDKMRRRRMEEERIREIYGPDTPFTPCPPVRPRISKQRSSRPAEHPDSLPELLLAAFKIAMRDKKNVAICFLSVLVLLLALRPGSNTSNPAASMPVHTASDVMMQLKEPLEERGVPIMAVTSATVSEVVKGLESAVPVIDVEAAKVNPVETPIQEPTQIDGLVDTPQHILSIPDTVAVPTSTAAEVVKKEEDIPI